MTHPTRGRRRRFGAVLTCAVFLALSTATCATATTSAPTAHAAISKSRCAANRAAGKVTYVSPFTYGAIPGILEVFAAQKLGYFADECLNVSIIANSYSPNPLVSADTAQFTSTGSAADALLAIGGGSKLVAIATLADTSTYVLLTHPGLTSLKGLEGGTLAYHTPLPVMISEMLAKAGVDVNKVRLINDKTYNPLLLPEGKFDALQAYAVNEPLALQEEGKTFKEWKPSSFGISGTFNTILANTTFVKDHPTATADFLRAELHAYAYCAANAHVAQCVGIEQAAAKAGGAPFDVKHANAEWTLSVSLMQSHALPGNGIGVETEAEWQPEAQAMVTYKAIKQVPSLTVAENTTIAPSLYRGTKLIWPAP